MDSPPTRITSEQILRVLESGPANAKTIASLLFPYETNRSPFIKEINRELSNLLSRSQVIRDSTKIPPTWSKPDPIIRINTSVGSSPQVLMDTAPLDLNMVKFDLIPAQDVILGDFLGSGAFGTVRKANWHGTQVAVKLLNIPVSQDFLKEGKKISQPLLKPF